MLSFVGTILTMTKSLMTAKTIAVVGGVAAGCVCVCLASATAKKVYEDWKDVLTKEEREERDKEARAEKVEKAKEKTENAARARANVDTQVKRKQSMVKKPEAPEETYEPEYNKTEATA